MLELHASEFVIDSLDNDFSGLVEFLAAGFFSGFPTLFYKLHEFFFFQFPRELALSINLVVLFLAMRLLVSFEDMLNDLVSSATPAFVAGNCSWLELLMLFGFITASETWRVGIVVAGSIGGWFMLLQDLGVQKLEGNQWIVNEGF